MIKIAEKTINTMIEYKVKDFGEFLSHENLGFTIFSNNGDLLYHNDCVINNIEQLFKDAREFLNQNEMYAVDSLDSNVYAKKIGLDLDNDVILTLEIGNCQPEKRDLLKQALKLFGENISGSMKSQQQIEMVSSELSDTYEELVLMYKLSSNMSVTQADSNYLQLACDSLTDIINVEGIAILVKKQIGERERLVLTAGAGLIDMNNTASEQLYFRLEQELAKGKEALLDSEIDRPFKYQWPERIKNIIAVPLKVNEKCIGVLVAANRQDKADFDSIDIKLFNSVAYQCAGFIENGRLFHDIKELLFSSLKALTTSIDAKDPYTSGHSERVAIIARWIGEQLAETEDVSEEYIQKIYIAGLLHDIGKIGIGESVLCKNGRLTGEEMEVIKTHPSIGASIMSKIKQMTEIVPGIVSHHEKFDGTGYPNKLKGNEIPLMGKIISVADAFDAMTSRRVYRDALSLDIAIEQIKKNIGTQFDEQVANAFLESDLYSLWAILQEENNNIWQRNELVEYSTGAVGALIK